MSDLTVPVSVLYDAEARVSQAQGERDRAEGRQRHAEARLAAWRAEVRAVLVRIGGDDALALARRLELEESLAP